MYGDDFDLTGGLLKSFPMDLSKIESSVARDLSRLAGELRVEMKANPTVKKNKGMIYNWHIPSCRKVTDQSDLIWARVLGAEDLLPRLQIETFKTVRSDQGDAGSE
jgi:hypothetical protein